MNVIYPTYDEQLEMRTRLNATIHDVTNGTIRELHFGKESGFFVCTLSIRSVVDGKFKEVKVSGEVFSQVVTCCGVIISPVNAHRISHLNKAIVYAYFDYAKEEGLI